MKKYFIILSVIGFLSTACNPNEELYENIEKNTPPYHTDFEITLTEDDYSTIAGLAEPTTAEDSAAVEAIEEYAAFAHNRSASEYVGPFLDREYLAPDSTSSVKVTYKYEISEHDSLVVYEFEDEDYLSIGGQVADSLAFSYSRKPGTYLPDFLSDIDETPNYLMYVICEYIKEDFSRIDTALVYTYENGSWNRIPNTYTLVAADYDWMGDPGAYNNFSDSDLPREYLGSFLRHKYRTALPGEQIYVMYKFYTGSATEIRSDIYEYKDDGSWTYKLNRTDQFVHNGTQWLFDPTEKYTMVKSDYDILVQYIKTHPELSGYFDDYYENSEYYYGASTYYDNFDMRVYKRQDNDPLGLLGGMSDEEIKVLIFERLKEGLDVFLEIRFPDAQPVSNGVQVFYEVFFATYEPGNYFYKMRFKVTGEGEFEYVEGPISLL